MSRSLAKNLCIIPARGGSKRIPRKNIKSFSGKPIIAFSIEIAISSGLFEEVMVSTDDQEIAEVAKEYGAKVPFMRSEVNANDYASTIDVINEVIDCYSKENIHFDNVCCLYATAPLATSQRLIEGYKLLSQYESVLPVTAFSFPILRAFTLRSGDLGYKWPEYEKSRSQDMEEFYHDAGQWYWLRNISGRDTLVSKSSSAVVLSNMEVQDIDTEEDWKLAEVKYEYLQRTK